MASFCPKQFLKNLRRNIADVLGLTKYRRDRRKYDIGRHSYLGRGTVIENSGTKIGAFCSIADGVQIGLSNHPLGYLSTHMFAYTGSNVKVYGRLENQNVLSAEIGLPVEIGNDVWIGQGAKIFGGVKIGTGAVVGACALVVKDVPPYAIVAGIPAKIIRFRFSPEIVEGLLKTRWWDLPDGEILKLPLDSPEKCVEILSDRK